MEELRLEGLEKLKSIIMQDEIITNVMALLDGEEVVTTVKIKITLMMIILQFFGNDNIKELLQKESIREQLETKLEPIFNKEILEDSALLNIYNNILADIRLSIDKKENNYYKVTKLVKDMLAKIGNINFTQVEKFIGDNKEIIERFASSDDIKTIVNIIKGQN